MDPVGIEFLTAVPEVTESSPTSPAEQGSNQGEFLSQFLGMLFADPLVDAESDKQLSKTSDEPKETTSLSAGAEQILPGELENGELRKFENTTENLPNNATSFKNTGWAGPSTGLEIAQSDEAGHAGTREDASPQKHLQSQADSVALQKERESAQVLPRETEQSNKAQVIESSENRSSAGHRGHEATDLLSGARNASEHRESKIRVPVTERGRVEISALQMKSSDRMIDPAKAGSELGNSNSEQPVSRNRNLDQSRSPSVMPEADRLPEDSPGRDAPLSSFRGKVRPPVAFPAWVSEREGLHRESPADQLDSRKAGSELGNPSSEQPVSRNRNLDQPRSPSVMPETERLPEDSPGRDAPLSSFRGKVRPPVAFPAWVSEREGLHRESPADRLDSRKAGSELGNTSSEQAVSRSRNLDQFRSPSVMPETERLPEDSSGRDAPPSSFRGKVRPQVASPAWVPQREGLVRETRGISLEARKIEFDVTKPPTAAADLGAQTKQNEPRNQPETDYETQEEQLLRRLAVSRNSGQVEENKTLAREAEPIVRFQVEPERSVNGTSKPANPEAVQSSETPTTARPDAGALQGSPRLTVHEPQLAREMVNLHRAEDFDRIADQIVKRMSLSQKGETFQVGVRLKPEFLGEVRIETIMGADRSIRAVIHAEDPSVKALLEGKVASLVQRFDDLGIHVDKVEVQTMLTDVGSGNDTSKERQGLGHSDHEKSPERVASELGDGLEEASEEEIDDGHIHLFI